MSVLVLLIMYMMEVEFFMVNSLSGLGNNFILCSSVVFLIVSIVNMIMMKEMSEKVGKWVFQVVGLILLSISIFYFSGLGFIAVKVFKIVLSNGGVDNVFVIGDFIMVRKNFSESEMLDMCLKYWGNFNIRHNTSYIFPEIDVERMISDKKSIREIYGELNGIYNKMHLESLEVKGIIGVLMKPDIKFFLCVGGMWLSWVFNEYLLSFSVFK